MFGRIRRKREEKRDKRDYQNRLMDSANKKRQAEEQIREQQIKQEAPIRAQQASDDRKRAYEEGRKRAEELFSRDVQGLNPEKRKALQYEAMRGIDRSAETANRKLLGEQGRHGIVGKGGVGYAQQKDLNRMQQEAQAGVVRDLDKLDADLALKKLAAMFNIEQGEASQAQLDKQLALDELNLQEERRRQRFFEDQFNKQFSRV